MSDSKVRQFAEVAMPLELAAFDALRELASRLSDTPSAELAEVAARQELEMQMIEAQARAAQQLAIANRIRLADSVEIEEIYEAATEGGLGLRGDAKAKRGTLGAEAARQVVKKRIYRFSGSREITDNELAMPANGEQGP